ncbi:hypothetical protein F5B18DRAFT_657907 [Nemania serpens]|nr:hypothetical protein F5B18DRAFT_657907 [Nemania serpens]
MFATSALLLAISVVKISAAVVFAALAVWGPKSRLRLLRSKEATISWISRLILESGVVVAAVLLYCAVITSDRSSAVFNSGIIVNIVIDWIGQLEHYGLGSIRNAPGSATRIVTGLLAASYIITIAIDAALPALLPEIVLIVVCSLHRLSIAAVSPIYGYFHFNSYLTWRWPTGNLLGTAAVFGGLALEPLSCRLLLYSISSSFNIWFGLSMAKAYHYYHDNKKLKPPRNQPRLDDGIEMLAGSQSKPESRYDVE